MNMITPVGLAVNCCYITGMFFLWLMPNISLFIAINLLNPILSAGLLPWSLMIFTWSMLIVHI
ncbi:hypothetical protein ACJX0J_021134, partial [Zea mays]